MKDTTIAVGLAKNVFEIAISREAGKVSKQLRVSRLLFITLIFDRKQWSLRRHDLQECGVGQSESRERGGARSVRAGNHDFRAVLDEESEHLEELGSLEGRDEDANQRRNHTGMVPADRRLVKFGARG